MVFNQIRKTLDRSQWAIAVVDLIKPLLEPFSVAVNKSGNSLTSRQGGLVLLALWATNVALFELSVFGRRRGHQIKSSFLNKFGVVNRNSHESALLLDVEGIFTPKLSKSGKKIRFAPGVVNLWGAA
jgi:hypothetical protein